MEYSPSTFKNVKMSSFLHLLFDIVIISAVTRGLSQGGNLAKTDPLASTQKKTWETMVNLDVDGYTKTLNHRKIFRKMQKTNNLLKTKTILKPNYKLSGSSVFTFSLPGGEIRPSALCQLRHWLWYFVFTYNRISCAYSSATRYVMVALLSVWEGLQVV